MKYPSPGEVKAFGVFIAWLALFSAIAILSSALLGRRYGFDDVLFSTLTVVSIKALGAAFDAKR